MLTEPRDAPHVIILTLQIFMLILFRHVECRPLLYHVLSKVLFEPHFNFVLVHPNIALRNAILLKKFRLQQTQNNRKIIFICAAARARLVFVP